MHPTQFRLVMNLKQLRQAKGLPQKRLAEKAGLSLGYIDRLEVGRHDPSLSTLIKLAEGLRAKAGRLLE